MKFLITFKSTTATFRADKMLTNIENLYISKKIVSIPYKLSSSCYGLGLELSTTIENITKIKEILIKNQIDVKHFWQLVDDEGNYSLV